MKVGTAMSAPQAARRLVTSVSPKVIMATFTWNQVVVDVPVVVLQTRAHLRDAAAVQLADRLEQRQRRVLQRGELLPDVVEPLDVGAQRLAGEDLLLELLELVLDRVEHGKITVDDRVDQGVEDETRAALEQFGLALAACAYRGEARLGLVANREDVVPPDKEVDLADLQLVRSLDVVQHREQRVAVLLD